MASRVERFDRRGTEPFELFSSKFGQNSVKIQYILIENSKIIVPLIPKDMFRLVCLVKLVFFAREGVAF